jgi:hypothetical protein
MMKAPLRRNGAHCSADVPKSHGISRRFTEMAPKKGPKRMKSMSSNRKLAIAIFVFTSAVIALLSLILSPILDHQRLLDAAENGDLATVTKLLDKGIDINTKDGWSGTPMMYAAANGHTDIVALLLTRGVGINSISRLDRTPLMCAANGGHNETVKYLIEHGADLSMKDREEKTALMLAIERGHASTATIIREYLGRGDVKSVK